MRKDRVLDVLSSLCAQFYGDAKNLSQPVTGFTTDEIAEQAGILRNNCSAELNRLLREGLVVKSPGRPTRYLTAPYANRNQQLGAGNHTVVDPNEHETTRSNWLGEWGPGSDGILREAIQQALVALSYPPHGMHTLLLGETGVGKSTFARKMHAFAIERGLLAPHANFVAFNCAEYANNPEVLLDQLFGHVRGAFTGATQDKDGLVEHANQGILFLDEVHRLPPEGQEILFHLLDFGEYRRMGETHSTRKVQVLLVAATTESPESALLSTFQRRIPVVIRIPSLRDWPIRDRYELLYKLCQDEARILKKTIRVEAAALKKLLMGTLPANIGDLKNHVRLACARVYSLSRDRANVGGDVTIRAEHVIMPPQAKQKRPSALNTALALTDMVVAPMGQAPVVPAALTEQAIYGKLDKLSRSLQGLGFESDEIMSIIERELFRVNQSVVIHREDELRKFVGDTFFTWMHGAWNRVSDRIPKSYRELAFAHVTMHLYGLYRTQIDANGKISATSEMTLVDQPEFYEVSRDLLSAFAKESGIEFPDKEVVLVALLLGPGINEKTERIGIVVAMYGDYVASSMVETATRIVGGERVEAVDIPLPSTQDDIEERIGQAVKRVDRGRGVLIMTDVENIVGLETRKQLNSKVIWFLRPDTRAIVFALVNARLSLPELRKRLPYFASTAVMPMVAHTRWRVWSCCLTGKGTAHAVMRLLLDALPEELLERVDIVPKELSRQSESSIEPDEGLIAAVGSIDPGVPGVPFFSVEELLSGDGIDRLTNLLYYGPVFSGEVPSNEENRSMSQTKPRTEEPQSEEQRIHEHVERLLERDLVYVNPTLVLSVCKEMMAYALDHGVPYRIERYARFCLHTAYMIERLIQGDGMLHAYVKELPESYPREWSVIQSMWGKIEERFRLPPNAHEMAYLLEFFFGENMDKEVHQ